MNNRIILIIFAALIGWTVLNSNNQKSINGINQTINLPYSEFLDMTEDGEISQIKINGNKISGTTRNGQQFTTNTTYDDNLIETLRQSDVEFEVAENTSNPLLSIILGWFPILLLIAVWIFFMRRMQGGGGGAFGFGKSKARMIDRENNKITFNDVAGIQEAKQDLQEIVDFLKEPDKFSNLGAKIPKGVLLVGPPGTGKTLTARAVAGEAEVPFFTISGSDFVEMFVGVGASRVRNMFEEAKKNAPCIIFIDEIDAVGRSRGAGIGGGNDEREQTLNQLLVEMDGFEENLGIIIIAATNRPDVLDNALLRPGRFDRQVTVDNPDVEGREQILRVHLNKIRVAPDVDERIIARGTPGFSGAQLANLANEAALLAARRNKKFVSMIDIEDAKDKVMMGAEKKHSAMTQKEKELTAYHEAGHAICTLHQSASDPIHKATIIPRGRALGMVVRLPEGDRISVSYEKLKADLVVAMGGRVAEELVYGDSKVTTGASSDIDMATQIATRMVTEWGMSKKLGKIKFSKENNMFNGQSNTYSEDTAKEIDREIKDIIDSAYNEAKQILEEHYNDLETLTEALLEYETLSGDEINKLLAPEKDITKGEKKEEKQSFIEIPKTNTKKIT
jgi:cell division protease FtsH